MLYSKIISIKKVGLVLSGGGVKGAYEAGVLNILAEHKLIERVDIISGSSIGALNAIYLAEQLKQKKSFFDATNNLVNLWLKLDQKKVMKVDIWGIISKLIYKAQSVFSTDPIVKILKENDIPETRKIRDYLTEKIELLITRTNLNRAIAEVFDPEESVYEAMLISAAFPGAFPSRQSADGDWCTDGGVLDNTPIKPVIRAGAEKIWVLYLAQEQRLVELNKEYKNAKDVLARVIDLIHSLLIF
ncbi:MAG: patatin-like phospholipase family protein, partial [Candidatus Margulisbacteria bacterium]|nr:patatin-like phospholipase family protein [Candidatus Margulisiibacteriota bacterium]